MRLGIPNRKAYRLANTLGLCKTGIQLAIPDEHPLAESLIVVEHYYAKAVRSTFGSLSHVKVIYTIADISRLWPFGIEGKHYSTYWTRVLLEKLQVPIYNKQNKGIIYLIDLLKLQCCHNDNFTDNRERHT
jgi:hypothetical protein